ncbi:uncharacterized protein ACWYII_040739 [Salvelinus alpinus]
MRFLQKWCWLPSTATSVLCMISAGPETNGVCCLPPDGTSNTPCLGKRGDYIMKLVERMPRVCKAVINAKAGFSPVGERLRRAPSRRLQTSLSDHLSTAIRVEADSLVPVHQTVVSLYDYSAHRSDELTVPCGDAIRVLYKDNRWFGLLANRQHGYLAATYVVEERNYKEELSHALEAQSALSERTDLSDERLTPTKVSATVVSGELKFISELDTDPEQSAATKGKKTKKLVKKFKAPSSPPPATSSDPDVPESSSTKRKTKAADSKPLTPSPRRGQSNSAFEPDT